MSIVHRRTRLRRSFGYGVNRSLWDVALSPRHGAIVRLEGDALASQHMGVPNGGAINPRDIPMPIQRAVRQRCGFGCVVCGLPLYEYDHILGWASVQRHVAEEITLLCDQHHREKTSGLLSNDAVKAANDDPYNLRKGVSKPYNLHYEGDECQLIIGGNRFRSSTEGDRANLAAIVIDGEVLVGFRFIDHHYLLHVTGLDEENMSVLEIRDNVLAYAVSPWDVAWVGRRLTIRDAPRAIFLELQFNPPNEVRIERGRLLKNGVELELTPETMLVNGRAQATGNDFVGSGITIGEPIGGGLAIRRVNRYQRLEGR